jgi:hypothetical protein
VGVIGIFFGGYSIQQPAFKSFERGRAHRNAVSISLRDDRVRGMLGLSWTCLFGHDIETDR